ncbi:SRPBCC family protein [Micromonospora sp. C32]|uniref:SRPBCC family protein n=1 Tax=unclassified Micromonospora TaxID=2617518 RepID=UPI001B36F7B7|nr:MULTISPECIES: SRPBCC family protein [unclassified Micromonospora]MBQ1042721.1 SRPBCC family protein [Micromonospora sp. C72]MBQ1054163.1 SRPBCC family protein [Micromonospora sp. C32]
MATTNLTDRVRDEIGGELRNLASALGERAVQAISDRVTDATGRLTEYAKQGGDPGLVAAATGARKLAEGSSPVKAMFHAGVAGGKEKLMAAFGRKGGGDGGRKLKVTNIVETIEVGVPVRVAYNQWTTFGDFPSFMKKVEQADCDDDEKMTWKAQVLWSHRTWESTIVRQIPDRLIHWRSTGEKGSVDGTVSFHEVAPELTRILVVLEYHPQGFFEHTGNLWRAQGRRVRLELKHFVRHVMTRTVLDPDAVEGWRGEIEDSQVVKDHETALREERGEAGPAGDEYAAYDEGNDFDDDEYAGEPVLTEPERARRRPVREQREPRADRRSRAPERPRRPAVRRSDES